MDIIRQTIQRRLDEDAARGALLKKLRKENKKWALRRLILELSCVVLIVYVLFGVLFGISVVNGVSMEPELKNGDIVFFYRMANEYKKNDIILIQDKKGEEIVKRIIATEGDVVDMVEQDGKILVNGTEEQICTIGRTEKRPDGISFPIEVGKGELFVLGDNREQSQDSRNASVGMAKIENVTGKAIALLLRKT